MPPADPTVRAGPRIREARPAGDEPSTPSDGLAILEANLAGASGVRHDAREARTMPRWTRHAAAALVLGVAASSATALTYNFGNVGLGPFQSPSFSAAATPTDLDLSFSLAAPAFVTLGGFGADGPNGVDVTGVFFPVPPATSNVGLPTGNNDRVSAPIALAPGAYTFRVTAVDMGKDAGKGNDQFFGQVQVAAVPEAHEWAMMLTGLGLIGWVAARRRRAHAPT
jgi:hypothetical protein